MGKTNKVLCSVALVFCLFSAGQVHATVLFLETFETDTTTNASTVLTYSPILDFLGGSGASATVDNGVLEMLGGGSIEVGGFSGDIQISALMGASSPITNSGGWHMSIGIGLNSIEFHPGFNGGAFRVEGVGGFGNQNLGFTPQLGVLHQLDVWVNATTGNFDLQFTDGGNAANQYNASFVNSNYTAGDVSFRGDNRILPVGNPTFFDNLLIETNVTSVPVPATLWLLGSGLIALFGLRGSYQKSI